MYPVSAISSNGSPLRYYKCITTKKRNCNVVNIDKEFIENIVKDFLNNQLIIKDNLDFIVNKVYEYYLKRASSKTSLNTIKTDLQRVNTSISNILLAIEKGIFTDTTKSRLEELEDQKKDLQEKLIIEESKEQYELTKESIAEYFNLALSETPAKTIELFVKCVKVYEDKIEINISNPMNKSQTEQSKKLLYTETQTKTRTFKGGTTKTTTKYYDIYLVV